MKRIVFIGEWRIKSGSATNKLSFHFELLFENGQFNWNEVVWAVCRPRHNPKVLLLVWRRVSERTKWKNFSFWLEWKNEVGWFGLVVFGGLWALQRQCSAKRSKPNTKPTKLMNDWCLSLVGELRWVMAGLPAMAPPKGSEPNQERKAGNQWINKEKVNGINQSSRRAAVSLKMKWSGAGCVDGMGGPRAKAEKANPTPIDCWPARSAAINGIGLSFLSFCCFLLLSAALWAAALLSSLPPAAVMSASAPLPRNNSTPLIPSTPFVLLARLVWWERRRNKVNWNGNGRLEGELELIKVEWERLNGVLLLGHSPITFHPAI